MVERSRSFESVTEVQPGGPAGAPLRHRPEVRWSDARGAHARVIEGRAVAGAAGGADIQLADSTVSRLHAEFEVRPDGLWVTDLGSTNGTFVEGLRVTSARLPEGARVRLGATELVARYAREATTVELWPHERFGPLIGRSVAMRELFSRLARVAPTDATVLIQGETGTGKELVARAVHEASPRAGGPFVIVDCAALPEQLLESELFGYVKGAFTGAAGTRIGAIESADGGTVFLDEVGELPLAMQPKLLRMLEARTVRRLGESSPRPVDVRFVSATHRDLRTMINAGAFREDLYFRLAVVPVAVPPLRERPDDVPPLLAHFLAPGSPDAVGPELLRELCARPWFGNVRELRNFAQRALALGAHEALSMVHSGASPAGTPPAVAPPAAAEASSARALLDLPFKEARERWLEQLEREYIDGLLVRHGHNVTAVAQAAGLDRSYVHKLIRRHRL